MSNHFKRVDPESVRVFVPSGTLYNRTTIEEDDAFFKKKQAGSSMLGVRDCAGLYGPSDIAQKTLQLRQPQMGGHWLKLWWAQSNG